MSLARFINDKILDPLIDAKVVAPNAERIAELVTERVTERVTEQVTADNNEQWIGWLTRRDAALAQGLEFNEPRPDKINGSEP